MSNTFLTVAPNLTPTLLQPAPGNVVNSEKRPLILFITFSLNYSVKLSSNLKTISFEKFLRSLLVKTFSKFTPNTQKSLTTVSASPTSLNPILLKALGLFHFCLCSSSVIIETYVSPAILPIV